jgi:MFS family permease
VYSWSVFARPLVAAFHWSTMSVTWTFALAIFSLGIGAIAGGRWQDRVGPRYVALGGIALWALGNILAGAFTARLGVAWLYAMYGVVGGFGLGMGYVSPVAMVTKWFPDRRGLAGGLVICGFGLGAVVYNLVASLVSLRDVHAIMTAFVWSGIAYLVVGGGCAAVLRDPPHGYGRRGTDPTPVMGRDYTPSEVLRTPQFYLLWGMLFCSVTAGILVISSAVPIFTDLTGATPALATATVGLLATCNGIGRILWGALSDRIGRNLAFAAILVIQALVFVALPALHGVVPVAAAFGIVLLCNGGSFGTMPAFNADYFGTKHLGLNYGMLITAWGCAGVAGPLLAARVVDLTGSYSGILVPIGAMLFVATILPAIARPPSARRRYLRAAA